MGAHRSFGTAMALLKCCSFRKMRQIRAPPQHPMIWFSVSWTLRGPLTDSR